LGLEPPPQLAQPISAGAAASVAEHGGVMRRARA